MKKKRRQTLNHSHAKFSLCMIVKNEAENLAPCINSVKPVMDEIIVVDTGSTDNTKEIAERLGAKVFDFPWCDDFSAARNESIRYATGNYILWLDGDDRVDESEVKKIGLLKKRVPFKRNEAYYVIVNNQSPIDGESRYYQMRIFPRVKGVLFEGRVHEQVFHNLGRMGIKLVRTDIVIRHTGYHDAGAVITKSERNLRIIEEALKSDPDNFLLHYNAARTLGINRQAEAIAHMKRITENDMIRKNEKQLFLQASLLLGKYHTDLKLYDEAISIYKNLSCDFEDSGLIHIFLGQTLFSVGNYKEAIEALRKSMIYEIKVDFFPVNLDQLHYYQYYTLGQCYLETGESDLAKEMFIKSLNRHRDHFKSLEVLGLLSLKDQKFKDAIVYYERAIQEGGVSDSNYANIGLAYRKLGLCIEAEKSLIKALEINPQRIEALTNLGHLYHKNDDSPRAVHCFTKALNLDPNLKDVRLALSDIYFRLSDIENLVGQCDALLRDLNLPRNVVLENFSELSSLYEKIGEALTKNGLHDLSQIAYRVSFRIHPTRGVLDKLISVVKIQNDIEMVDVFFRKTFEDSGRRMEEADRICRLYLEKHMDEKALQWLIMAYEAGRREGVIASILQDRNDLYLSMGKIYMQQCDLDAAADCLQKADDEYLAMDEQLEKRLSQVRLFWMKGATDDLIKSLGSLMTCMGMNTSRCIESIQDLGQIIYDIAEEFCNRKQWHLAETALQLALQIAPATFDHSKFDRVLLSV